VVGSVDPHPHPLQIASPPPIPQPPRAPGRATRGPGGISTPEASEGPDEARNKADERRRQENSSQGTEGDGAGFATTKDQHPDDDDAGNESSTAEDAGIIQEVLKCGNDEHRKIKL